MVGHAILKKVYKCEHWRQSHEAPQTFLQPRSEMAATEAAVKRPSNEDVSLPTSQAPSTGEVKRRWYRSTLFNAFVIGGVGFMAPGLWNAMNDLGAAGALDPYLVNAANALIFGIMGILCLFGAPIANRIGLAWTLFMGAVGYPIYSGAFDY